jgi:hypothetical protein
MPRRDKHGCYIFPDYPEFRPNLSPRAMFKLGVFQGTYFREIYSSITKKWYKNEHKKFPKSWWKGIPEDHLTRPLEQGDKNINRFKVKASSSLREWERAGWIRKPDMLGWVQWYCNFFLGRRIPEVDAYQVHRWVRTVGPRSRFRVMLVNQSIKKGCKWNDDTCCQRLKQLLVHWAYLINKRDFDEIKNR